MKICVPKETRPGETRVALAPEVCKKLIKTGYTIGVESGAGNLACYSDDAYREVGVVVESDAAALFGSADLVLSINPPAIGGAAGRNEVAWMRPGTIVLTSLMPLKNTDVVRALAERKVTAFSTDAIPRTTRAQAMDTLSSMANIRGYKGVLLAAAELPKYFPMFMTAAGTVFPAKVFVVGAAVAGLQAIATARRLGANVVATDVRPEVKEEIESLGAKFVGVELSGSASAGGGYAKELSEEDKKRQQEMLAEQCGIADVVITTALIGGVFAPKVISADIVHKMRRGSILVDLGADGGGNCELSKLGQTTVVNGITILAPLNLPATMPTHASLLFGRNLASFVDTFTKDNAFVVDLTDDIQQGAIVTHGGEILHEGTKKAMQSARAAGAPN